MYVGLGVMDAAADWQGPNSREEVVDATRLPSWREGAKMNWLCASAGVLMRERAARAVAGM